jgi:hypothetical protein
MISVIYKRLIQIGKVTGTISFLLAAPYALAQYLQTKDAAQVEQSLNLFKQYNSAPFIGYREKISKVLINNKTKITGAAKVVKEFEKMQLQIVHDGDIETELQLLFDFFDSATVCGISLCLGLCCTPRRDRRPDIWC